MLIVWRCARKNVTRVTELHKAVLGTDIAYSLQVSSAETLQIACLMCFVPILSRCPDWRDHFGFLDGK
jgi:hypothetical protein